MDHDVDPSGECYVSEGRLSPAASSIGKKHSATPAGVRTTNRRLSLAMEEVFDQVCVCVCVCVCATFAAAPDPHGFLTPAIPAWWYLVACFFQNDTNEMSWRWHNGFAGAAIPAEHAVVDEPQGREAAGREGDAVHPHQQGAG